MRGDCEGRMIARGDCEGRVIVRGDCAVCSYNLN